MALALLIAALSAWAVLHAMRWPWSAALFPLAIGIPLCLLATLGGDAGAGGPRGRAVAVRGGLVRHRPSE
jgi:hypothetical protein